MDSSVVIKVKYGDSLRRFNARIVEEELNLTIDGMREKISALFKISQGNELMLTYFDDDGDEVTLVDEDDLRDVVKQALNPLRITVKLNTEKNSRQFRRSSGSSTPLRSPRVQPREDANADLSEILRTVQEPLRETFSKFSSDLASKLFSTAPSTNGQVPLNNLNTGVSEILRTVKEPLRETLVKLSTDLRSKSSTSAPSLGELVDCLSKLSLFYLNQLSDSTQSGGTKSSTVATETKDLGPSKSDVAASKLPENGKSEGKSVESNVGSKTTKVDMKKKMKKISNCSSNAMSSMATSHPLPVANNDSCAGKFGDTCSSVFELPSSSNNIPTGQEVNMPSNPVKGDTVDDKIKNVFPRGLISPGSIWAPSPFSGIVLHRGIRCDGCGVHPIAGPRFKSKVKVNYDLCRICFTQVENESHYLRMDFPSYHRFEGSHDTFQNGVCKGIKVKSGGFKLSSRFIEDVNIIDGTVMAPLTSFTKIWRMRNNGRYVWPHKTQLVWIGGDKLSNELSVEVEIPAAGFPVDYELDVSVDFVAPKLPGRYISYWRMASPHGKMFGQRVWVLIQVDASLKDTQYESTRGFNLNLLLVNGPEFTNLDPEPMVEESQPERNNSKRPVELVDLQQNIEHEMKFPINDSLLIGSGAWSSVPLADQPFLYPNIDVSYVESALSSVAPALLDAPSAPIATSETFEVEAPGKGEKLLEELEIMGFKQADLNKEILRLNNYDLEKSVDDLCGVSDWDPILGELQEMGFEDKLMNKMLLKKNNGSIKRVVMDLIAGEE